jgi:hypothetical protein
MMSSGGKVRELTLYGDRCVKKCHILTAGRCFVRIERSYNRLFLLMIYFLRHCGCGNSHAGMEFA